MPKRTKKKTTKRVTLVDGCWTDNRGRTWLSLKAVGAADYPFHPNDLFGWSNSTNGWCPWIERRIRRIPVREFRENRRRWNNGRLNGEKVVQEYHHLFLYLESDLQDVKAAILNPDSISQLEARRMFRDADLPVPSRTAIGRWCTDRFPAYSDDQDKKIKSYPSPLGRRPSRASIEKVIQLAKDNNLRYVPRRSIARTRKEKTTEYFLKQLEAEEKLTEAEQVWMLRDAKSNKNANKQSKKSNKKGMATWQHMWCYLRAEVDNLDSLKPAPADPPEREPGYLFPFEFAKKYKNKASGSILRYGASLGKIDTTEQWHPLLHRYQTAFKEHDYRDWRNLTSNGTVPAKETTKPPQTKKRGRGRERMSPKIMREMSELRDTGKTYQEVGASYGKSEEAARKLIGRYKLGQRMCETKDSGQYRTKEEIAKAFGFGDDVKTVTRLMEQYRDAQNTAVKSP